MHNNKLSSDNGIWSVKYMHPKTVLEYVISVRLFFNMRYKRNLPWLISVRHLFPVLYTTGWKGSSKSGVAFECIVLQLATEKA